MNTKQKTTKFIFTGFIALILMLMANFGFIVLKQPKFIVNANENNSIKTITLTNSNFESDSYGSYPDASFSGFDKDYSLSSDEKPSVEAGIINLDDDDYSNKFINAKKEGNKHVLMIESNTSVNYGYKTKSNNTISIKPNSYYMITADVYTETNANIASLYLFNGEETFASIKNINSYLNWQTYTFLISTNDLTETTLNLGMYLEGHGTVLFDNISAFELSKQQYTAKATTLRANNLPYVIKNSENNIVAQYKIENSGFTKSSEDFNVELASYNSLKENSRLKVSNFLPNKDTSAYTTSSTTTSTDGTNNSALLIENKQETYIQYSTDDDFFTFKQNQVYKVSLNIKTENLNGNANIQLVRANAEENDSSAKDSSIIKITSNTASDGNVNNNYKTYSFYVCSDPTKDTNYKLVFGLGDEENLTTGKLYVNTLTISNIDYKTFSNASNDNKLDLASHYAYSNTDNIPMLNNGEFDAMQITDVFSNQPATPTNWSVTLGKNTQYYGVVNTLNSNFNKLEDLNTSNLANPYGDANINNNILMMYNETNDTLSYKSATKSLSANSYHNFQIAINTQHAEAKVSLVTTLNNKEVELVSKTITTNLTGFEDVSLYIHTANQKLDVALKITLISSGYGYVYVDNARFDYLIAPTEADFNNVISNTYIEKIDLSKKVLSYFSSEDVNNSVVTKIIDFENESDINNFAIDKDSFTFIKNSTDEVLAIRAAYETYYKLTSKLGYDLSANKYYKVSVDVYTQFIDSSIEDADLENVGASINLIGLDSNFTSIKSNNTWTTYTFYINSESSKTIYLEFALGNETNLAKGDVFFGNINIEDVTESLSEDGFNKLTESDTIKIIKPEETSTEEEPDTDKTTDEEKEPVSVSTILYFASGIITALAIIIAIIGFLARKIKFKKPVKKSKNSYDRNKTVSKQIYSRKATTERENKLVELRKDLEKITEERTKFEEQYKSDLYKLRELKIKRANASEISKFEKEMKKNQKLSASLGITANKIQSQIEYVKTDAYLNALMKKLERDAHNSTNSSNEK